MAAKEDLLKKLQGIRDPRGPVGEMSRGANMYPGGNAAHQGGGQQFGRPPNMPQPNAMAIQNANPNAAFQRAPGSITAAKPNTEQMIAAARRRLQKRAL